MARIEQQLDKLGVELPEVAKPAGVYVPAVRSGDYVYTSGQLPFVNGELKVTGKLGGGVSIEDGYEAAKLAAVNGLAAVKSVIGDLDRVQRVVKVVGFVASEVNFTAQPAVINGASELLGEIFGEAGQHARSAVGVPVLPLDSPVEVEIIVEYV